MGKRSRKKKRGRDKKAENAFISGEAFFKNGGYKKAISKWKEWADGSPEMRKKIAEAYFRSGLDFYKKEDLNSVTSNLSMAVKLDPDTSIYWYHLGLSYHRVKKWNKAISSYKKALSISPENERYLFHLALAFLLQGRDVEAISIISKRIDSPGRKYRWSHLLAIYFLKNENPQEALKILNRDGNQGDPGFLKGISYLMMGDLKHSLLIFEKLLSKSTTVGASRYYLGLALLKEGKLLAGRSLRSA